MSVSCSPTSLLSSLLGFAVVVLLSALENVGRNKHVLEESWLSAVPNGRWYGVGGGGTQKLF
jgi:hypothetical protein